MCASTLGDVLSTIIYASGDLPVPSWCEPLWLGFYPPFVVAAGADRGRVHGLRSGCGSTAPRGARRRAVMSATLVAPLLRQVAARRRGAAHQRGLPGRDLVVVAALVATTAVGGWRLDRRWVLLLAGTLAFVAADCAYLADAAGTYADGGIPDVGWIGAALVFGVAAWAPQRGRTVPTAPPSAARCSRPSSSPRSPSAWCSSRPSPSRGRPLTLVFAGATLAVVVGRLTAVHADHQRLLRESRLDAATDELTGLWNRRRLMADLEATTRADPPGCC